MQRGHTPEPVFFEAQDYLEYLKILKRVAEACHCAIHAYILMTNHIHLLLTPEAGDSISRLFQEELLSGGERGSHGQAVTHRISWRILPCHVARQCTTGQLFSA
jgi:hypothetical protein